MAHAARRFSLVFTVALAPLGCNALLGVTDLGAGAGDAGDATPPPLDAGDAAAPPADATTARDAQPVDGDARDDAGQPPFSCAKVVGPSLLFCSDFDESAAGPWGWAAAITIGGGANALDTTTFASPPASYLATTPAASAATIASLSANVTSSAATLVYSFRIFPKTLDTGPGRAVTLARIHLGAGDSSVFFDLVADHSGIEMQELSTGADGGTQVASYAMKGALGHGTRVEMTLVRSGAWSMSLTLDGVNAGTFTPPVTSTTSSVEIDLGLLFAVSPTGPNSVSFDDVSLVGTP
jgi:hypothetical protein